ncbi:hypothetical protein [Halomicrobium katesii]|uniref:hypothetical protein n=1 Tax=Halomicrobium katesii TaxID=437163 RepID=UPI00036E79EC|nr:hypothetical protein [Halomicrobium katesii]
MTDTALRQRLDAALVLLAANFLLLLVVAFEVHPPGAVGALALTLLVAYGHLRGS